ncbi:MAG TPA: TIGR01777 family oxidoreductase [Solirubrobacteraceae bacterium]|nr:TIGR01777 family oxidoreductase [Solirubrobacteraceae bacterium]
MNVTLTGATGLIGTGIVRALQARGDAVTVLSRDPDKARAALGDVDAHAWRPREEPAPAAALSGRDAVVHLAGESVAQRWTDDARRAIHDSRERGTRNLVAGLAAAEQRPGVLVSASGVNYYGPRGDEPLTEDAPPGDDFLARVCRAWEREAAAARELGLRVATLRTAVVLDLNGGALSKMLPFFRLGIGGPVAGGRQYLPWIHAEDIVGLYLAALDGADWVGAANACAPEPATNRDFSRALGRALHRPALAPIPGFAVRLLYGDMAEIVTTGQRTVPMRALEHGYAFRHTDLDEALRDALG